MDSLDLERVMRRVADQAATIDRRARKGESVTRLSENVLHELSGVCPSVAFRSRIGADASTAVFLAKSVRLLAAMVAANAGVTLQVAGILDDMGDTRNYR